MLRILVLAGAAAVCNASGIVPDNIVLAGPGASQQFVVTGRGCVIRSTNPRIVRVDPVRKMAIAVNAGSAEILARCGSQTARTRIEVRAQSAARPEPRFSPDVISVLTIKGCNGSGCHGSPAGQNGFKLSLFGYDTTADRAMIVEANGGRRVDLTDPAKSLLLRKPLFEVPHGGGRLMDRNSEEYRTLFEWLRNGAKLESAGARLVKLEAYPAEVVLTEGGNAQPVAVIGRLSDGTTRDMTREVRYSASNESVARVEAGVLRPGSRGLAAVLARGMGHTAAIRVGVTDARPPDGTAAAADNFIDTLAAARQRSLNVRPAALSNNAEFLRRVYFDTIGRPPTPAETREFTANPDRPALIERLLARPEYAVFWTVKFEDWFRNNQLNSQGRSMGMFKEWIRDWLADDKPYDQMVREILTSEGDTFITPATAFWAPATDFMLKKFEFTRAVPTVTRLFLGVRLECAECHNHPLENYTQDDFYGVAAFFARMRVKHGYGEYRRTWYLDDEGEITHPVTKKPVAPKLLGAGSVPPGEADRRAALAAWITSPANPFFARATVNRIWHEYFGAGIIEPFDDLRSSNPPSNPELLDALARHFTAGGFRFKPLHRAILNSRTYQLSSRPPEGPPNPPELERLLFARYQPRPIPAEALLDSVSQVSGVPHTFSNHPKGTRAMEIYQPDGPDYFLVTFGFPRRDILCERSASPTLARTLHMMNGKTIQDKVENKENILVAWETASDREVARLLYERAFARQPDDAEEEFVREFLRSEQAAGRTRRKALEGLLWATLVSREFQINH
ncbi:MAG: DUF1553 domain-containing protein [Acidobacteria bacterium]|nr:DUF1553 domain-containing protein [Acidobacteriota bacterium]